MIYFYLLVAIVAEVVATIALRESQNFTKLMPSIVMIVGYALSFYLLTIIVQKIPLGVAYALWSGLGLLTISIISIYLYREVLDIAAWLGIILILSGVIVIRFFSGMTLSN